MPQPKWWVNGQTHNHMKSPIPNHTITSLGNKWKLVAAAEQMIERWQKGVCPIVRQTDCGWLIHIHALHCIWLYCQGGQTWCQSIAHCVANIPIQNTMETFEQSLPFQMGVQKLFPKYYKDRKNLSSIRSPPHCSAGSARYSPHSAHIDTRRAWRNILSVWAYNTQRVADALDSQ